MPRITYDLLRKRAEHNDGIVATLEELSLHGQDIEAIELVGQACRHLKILYLQNNVIGRIENVHKLKDLEYLNLALNNIVLVENLQGCESLQKLDLTANFIAAPAGLLSVASLAANTSLNELFLTGNPCEKACGYRQFVVGALPQLQRLDGTDITPKERIAAAQDEVVLEEWGPAARLREHLEAAAEKAAREDARRNQAMDLLSDGKPKPGVTPAKRADFDPLPANGVLPPQKNECAQQYTLADSADGGAIVLEVAVGRYLDTAEIKVDVQPLLVRCLVRGRLLQLHTPEEVRPDASICERSKTTGALQVVMPKAAAVIVSPSAGGRASKSGAVATAAVSTRITADAARPGAELLQHAKVTAVSGDDCDEPPPL